LIDFGLYVFTPRDGSCTTPPLYGTYITHEWGMIQATYEPFSTSHIAFHAKVGQRDRCGTQTLVCYSTTQQLSTYFGLILNIILSLITFVQIVIPIYNSFYKVLIEHVMGTKIMDKLRNHILYLICWFHEAIRCN
jgi:hypothetical protein